MDDKIEKQKPGIKAAGFGGSEKNGESHRKNAARKKQRYLKNVAIRRELYQSRMSPSTSPGIWHERLKALSLGTA